MERSRRTPQTAKLEISVLFITIIFDLDKTTILNSPVECLLINGEDWLIRNVNITPKIDIQDNIIKSEKLTLITQEIVGQILLQLAQQYSILPALTEILKEITNDDYKNIQTRFTRTS